MRSSKNRRKAKSRNAAMILPTLYLAPFFSLGIRLYMIAAPNTTAMIMPIYAINFCVVSAKKKYANKV
jgi:hypothetical protein